MKRVIIILLFIIFIAALSSCNDNYHRLVGGYAITVEGDTISFYGGTLTYPFLGERDIRGISTKSNLIK